jgi:hypothetical protein
MITKISRLCKGRGPKAREVLEEAVRIEVTISEIGDSSISLSVECPYNTGSHRQRCKASHPEVDKKGKGVHCAYAMNIPYAPDFYHGK